MPTERKIIPVDDAGWPSTIFDVGSYQSWGSGTRAIISNQEDVK
jgi:hypothetical protein